MSTKKLDLVIGANYGDEGKGRTVNWLASKDSLVVLTNGGAQRGHTVLHDGMRHVFHHFGSGTLKGAVSYASAEFILNPLQFKQEYLELQALGITPKLYIDPWCRLTTPYDMMANILRSEAKGEHDSTGFGIWETTTRYQALPLTDRIARYSVQTAKQLREQFEEIRKYYCNLELVQQSTSELKALFTEQNEIITNFIDDLRFMLCHTEIKSFYELCNTFDHIICEQGQGLGLDSQADVLYGTPSRTGSPIAIELIASAEIYSKFEIDFAVTKYYVTRSYLSRHGAGELEGEDTTLHFTDETNQPNKFQGSIRFALFSEKTLADMLDRIECDRSLLTGPAKLVITHADATDTSKLKAAVDGKFNAIIYI